MNELSSLLKRTFEGLGFCQGDYEDAAAAIVWLESRGMHGIEALKSAWPRLARSAGTAVELNASDADTQVVNARGNSALTCGQPAVELAVAHALINDIGKVELQHCHEPHAILPSLCICATRGLNAIAYWQDDEMHVAMIVADQVSPDYYQLDGRAADNSAAETVTIACSLDGECIGQIASDLVGDDISRLAAKHVSANALDTKYQRSLERGIPIDENLASILGNAAAAVLVEATEQSRHGAGETAQ